MDPCALQLTGGDSTSSSGVPAALIRSRRGTLTRLRVLCTLGACAAWLRGAAFAFSNAGLLRERCPGRPLTQLHATASAQRSAGSKLYDEYHEDDDELDGWVDDEDDEFGEITLESIKRSNAKRGSSRPQRDRRQWQDDQDYQRSQLESEESDIDEPLEMEAKYTREGFFDRRDIGQLDPKDLDKDGKLQQMSLEELEERMARKWGTKPPRASRSASPRRRPDVAETQRRADEDDQPKRVHRFTRRNLRPAMRKSDARPVQQQHSDQRRWQRPVAAVASWGSHPPPQRGQDLRKVGGSQRSEEDVMAASGQSEQEQVSFEAAYKADERGEDAVEAKEKATSLSSWLMPSTKVQAQEAAERRRNEKERALGASDRIGTSKFRKMYKSVFRNYGVLPWERVDGETSWVDPSDKTWQDLGLVGENIELVLESLKGFGVERPNQMQAQAVPEIQKGRDVLLTSVTGSGKTLAFLLPLLQKFVLPLVEQREETSQKRLPLHLTPKVLVKPKLLIVAPGRELAKQTFRIVSDLLEPFPSLNVSVLLGKDNHKLQDVKLKERQPAVVIGTPGKLMDHAMEGRLMMSDLDAVVFDEVDSMMSMSRQDHVDLLLQHVAGTPRTQRILVSASGAVADERAEFAEKLLRNDFGRVGPKSGLELPKRVLHLVNGAPDVTKKLFFLQRLENSKPDATGVMVFCNNHERARKVAEQMRYSDMSVELLTGNRSKEARDTAVRRMNTGDVQFLVATDAAMRGLDFRDVTHVVNFELPGDAATYAHRAGRCGRMGFNGIVISLAGGGYKNGRLRLYADQLDFELFEANVNEGILGVDSKLVHSPPQRSSRDSRLRKMYEVKH